MWPCLLLFAQAPDFEQAVRPLLSAHCVECHSGPRPKGELDLQGLVDGAPAHGDPAVRGLLEGVRARIAAGEMPPPSRPRPPDAQLEAALGWLDAHVSLERAAQPSLRRLNRSEYERTVRDLFGVAYPARELFPADDVGALFDNDAAVATASELAVERWVEAAERVAARALPPEVDSQARTLTAKELEFEGGARRARGTIAMFSAGRVHASVALPRAGRYRVEVLASADHAGDEAPRLALEVDGRVQGEAAVNAERGADETIAWTATIEEGTRELGARFVNDFYDPENPDPKRRDRNVHVTSMKIEGPLDPPPSTAFTRWIDEQLERGSFASTLAVLGLRVWRRPLEPAELERLEALSPRDAPPRERLRAALCALLASPHFLYRVELEAPGAAISQYELATRLSYFLWASAPDEALLSHARSGALADDLFLASEARRMLRDARSRSLTEEFAGQWLGWRALERVTPDPRTFPQADAALLDSMRQECEAFFEAMLREDRPLAEFLDADFTFVDARLAEHYGLDGVQGEGVRRVHLGGGTRGGLLGQAALLTITSNPTRTSPVKRGKWILETLLGETVPPPPPGVGSLGEVATGDAPSSLRERLARHREDQDCASCHARLDPLGFALEGFDAIGAARTHDGERAIDDNGMLPEGLVLSGVHGLERYLVQRGAFPRSLARALFCYALGREPSPAEVRALFADVDALPEVQSHVRGVIEVVIEQPAFRLRGTP